MAFSTARSSAAGNSTCLSPIPHSIPGRGSRCVHKPASRVPARGSAPHASPSWFSPTCTGARQACGGVRIAKLAEVGPLQAARQFEPFGWSHAAAVVIFLVVAAVLVIAGRRCRGTPAGQRLSKALALAFVAFLIPVEVYYVLPWQPEIKYSLPLQLCDLASIAAVWALWSYSSTAFALTYFWGLTLTVQAFISPELHGLDFPSLQFVAFFGVHSLAPWAAIYLTWGAGLRPSWRS